MIVTEGENLYLNMLVRDALMHADLHPGNILILQRDRHRPQIALVDAGLVAKLTIDEQKHFIGLLHGIAIVNGHQAANHLWQMNLQQISKDQISVSEDELQNQYQAFSESMVDFFNSILIEHVVDINKRSHAKSMKDLHIDLGHVLRGCLQLIQRHRISIPANYVTLIVNALCLDSLAKQLVPEYDILGAAREILTLGHQTNHWFPSIKNVLYRTLFPLAMWRKVQHDKQWWSTHRNKQGNSF
jgi:predicted unusual protein kinase regulating ubiquinone biosynthesis (AarF/ABC1/UbiB family)